MKLAEKLLEEYGFKYYFLDSVDSTNIFLKNKLKNNEGTSVKLFCNALKQTNGYGQRNRLWHSNVDSLKFSFAFNVLNGIESLLPAGLKLALILRKILSGFHAEELRVKWPNDIYSSQGKICGILTEIVKCKKSSSFYVVIGIGINVNFSSNNVTLKVDSVNNLKINDLLIKLLPKISFLYNNLDNTKLDFFSKWSKFDFFDIGSSIILNDGKQSIAGVYRGLNDEFMPIIEVNKQILKYKTKNISLQKGSIK